MAFRDQQVYDMISDYVVFDLETTSFISSVCKVIEISAIRVTKGKKTATFHSFVNPEEHIPEEATRVNNIYDYMVENAPVINDVLGEFLDFIGDSVLIGHNIATFDLPIISRLTREIFDRDVTNNYIDTLIIARQCFPGKSHTLQSMAQLLSIDFDDLHRSTVDCETTIKLYEALKPHMALHNAYIQIKPDLTAFIPEATSMQNVFRGKTCIMYGSFSFVDSSKLQMICDALGMICIDYFAYSADYLILGTGMYEKYISKAPDDMIDAVVSSHVRVISESDFIRCSNIMLISGYNVSKVEFKFNVKGKKICLTGEFKSDLKDKIEDKLTSCGAIVKPNVIKGLDYLVIGSLGSSDWKDGKGGKRMKAEEYISKGVPIKIINESDFIRSEDI